MSKQQSVASLPEDQQDRAMAQVDIASRDSPSVALEGARLHVFSMDGEWQVWLNTEDADFTGLCVAGGPTRDAAVTEAVRILEAAVEILQGPPR